jgi:hypothetical protein
MFSDALHRLPKPQVHDGVSYFRTQRLSRNFRAPLLLPLPPCRRMSRRRQDRKESLALAAMGSACLPCCRKR